MDWLSSQNETGQSLKKYMNGGPHISWINPRCKTISIFLIDDTIDDETAELLKIYCEAFFLGCDVKVIKQGDQIEETTRGGAKRVKKVPQDFLKHHKITNRENFYGTQLHGAEINSALAEYKQSSTFCILAATNTDLYPKEEWNFVYGLANMTTQCGVFSFCRQMKETVDNLPEDQKRKTYLSLATGTMVHEISHMFGIKHCIHYECTMNGTMGSFE